MKRLVVYFLIGCVFVSAPSISLAADHMTLEDSIQMALENNWGMKAQDQDVMGSDMDKRVQFSQMLPMVNLSYGYLRYQDVQTMNVPLGPTSISIPFTSKGNYELDVQAKQILFAGGALYNSYLIAKNNEFAANINREAFARNLKLLVIDVYYAVIRARQQRELAKSNVSAVNSHLDIANAFFGQGMIPKNDLLEAQVQYAESEQQLIITDNAVKIAESNLNLLLIRNLLEEVNIDSEIPVTPLEITFEQALATALETRQEIRTTKLQIDNSEKGISIARSYFMPNVAATLAYENLKGDDPTFRYDTWKTGIGLNWNLFEGGANYWNYHKAQYMNTKAGYLLESLKNQVTLEVKNSFLNAQEAQARLQVAEKAIAQAEEYVRIQKDRYNLQVATTDDVLTAQALLVRAENNYITARADQARAKAALRAAMGIL